MTVEVHDKRFGVIAVEKGFITKEQLFEALKIQIEEELQNKQHNLIGLILIELGYLTHDQADEILLAMRK
jgi:predicted metal-dependent hydrolase